MKNPSTHRSPDTLLSRAAVDRVVLLRAQDLRPPVGWERDTDPPNPAGWLSLDE